MNITNREMNEICGQGIREADCICPFGIIIVCPEYSYDTPAKTAAVGVPNLPCTEPYKQLTI
jgi:hypothetical protein